MKYVKSEGAEFDVAEEWARLIASRHFGLIIAVAALLVVLAYVFLLTPYDRFLIVDMAGYWRRAMDRFNGEFFDDGQYMAYPPGYHIVLADMFRALRAIGLASLVRLETPLVVHMLVFSVSVYALQRIVVKWITNPKLIATIVLLYAFGYPSLYFHAFLLPDALAGSLFIIAIACIHCRTSWRWLLLSAAIFGFTAWIRPSFAPYGLPFIIYLFVRDGLNVEFIKRAAAFTAVFFAIVILAGMEHSRISGGKVTSISANGGLDFFIANARYHRVETRYDGLDLNVIVPALSWQPYKGTYYSGVPFYEQDHYYKLGWRALQHDPMRLIKNLEHVKHLFFSDMMPTRDDAFAFIPLMDVWHLFKFIMFLGFITYIWFWRELTKPELPLFSFLGSTILITFLVSYVFTGEPRYSYSILFCFYCLFFKLVQIIAQDWKNQKEKLLPAVVISVLGVTVAGATPAWLESNFTDTVAVQVQANQKTFNGDLIPPETHPVGRVLFPFNRTGWFNHADVAALSLRDGARVKMRTEIENTSHRPVNVLFDIYSSWPVSFHVDGEQKFARDESNFFNPGNIWVPLSPGKHTLDIHFTYISDRGGFAMSYNHVDATNWRHRNTLGVGDDLIRFSLPEGDIE